VPTDTRFSEIDDVPIKQPNATAQGGVADGPTAHQARAFKPRLLQKDKCDDAQENYAADYSIRHTVSHAHWVRRSDGFRHVQSLFNETLRRHIAHSRMMQVTSKIK
jgi:hypothetical protein